VRVFSKKQTSIFYSGQKASHKKNYRVTNFSIFHDFSIILSLITQRVFIAETCVRVRWKGISLKKIKNKKPVDFRHLEFSSFATSESHFCHFYIYRPFWK
jgi:hypothetical protein